LVAATGLQAAEHMDAALEMVEVVPAESMVVAIQHTGYPDRATLVGWAQMVEDHLEPIMLVEVEVEQVLPEEMGLAEELEVLQDMLAQAELG
jgi:hypothetical protein